MAIGTDLGEWGFVSYTWVSGLVGRGREAPYPTWCYEYMVCQVKDGNVMYWPESPEIRDKRGVLQVLGVWCIAD